MDDCLFCRICRGEIPAQKVYEDDEVLAFRDLHPVAPTHVLLVPKAHYADALELAGRPEAGAVWAAINRAAAEVAAREGLDKGFRLINNCGADGGQTVMHLHVHLIGGAPLGAKLV